MQFKKIIFLLAFIGTIFGFQYFSILEKNDNNSFDGHRSRIGIFQPTTHPALDEIAQAFIDSMQSGNINYDCTVYNANGNTMLMQAQAQEMIQSNYDLIFTIGVGCSLAIKEICSKKQSEIPVVFCAVDDPVKLNLDGKNITGVIEVMNYPEQLNLLLQIKPTIKKLLLVYDVVQASGLEKDKDEIRAILKDKNITLESIEISNISEIQQKVTGVITQADVVMILKDNTMVSGIDSLITLCQRYHVPLLATDLNSGTKGAVLAYGFYEAQSGIQGSDQAKLILEQGMKPCNVPIVAVQGMRMVINCSQMKLQGLDINLATLSLHDVELNKKGLDDV